MADFVPFHKVAGFEPHVFADQLDAARRNQSVEPIRAPAPDNSREIPNHSGDAPPGLDRSMPEAAPEVEEAPPGPTEEELLDMLREAHSRGKAEGAAESDEAIAAVRKEAAEELEKLSAVADALDSHRATLQAEAREQVGKLLILSLRRLTARTPELLDRILEARCGEVAEHMVGAGEVSVRVHPNDVDLARRFLGDRKGWRIEGDRKIRGGCVAESSTGRMDASLDAGLDAIQEAVKLWREEDRSRRSDG
jgi:flagellar biosynthesis/type III secretory pathway protein FliH